MGERLIIRGIAFGEGIPKICVPLTGKNDEELLREARSAAEAGVDLVEWRGDCCSKVNDLAAMETTAVKLRKILGNMVILFTCRTEDGQFSIGKDTYLRLNKHMIATGCVDLVDVELFMGDEICRELVEYAHSRHCRVIISNHDFEGTPNEDELVRRMHAMSTLGADLPKIAVMPCCKREVLRLLKATDTYHQRYGDRPIITMSMGRQGVLSRLSGEIFGSALTFATLGQGSAPGQIPVDQVRTVLNILHESC